MDVIFTFKQCNIHNIVVNILTSILTFFGTYITTKTHNMLTIMLDPWFKNLKIVSDFVGNSIVFQVIAKYNNCIIYLLFVIGVIPFEWSEGIATDEPTPNENMVISSFSSLL